MPGGLEGRPLSVVFKAPNFKDLKDAITNFKP
jgi:hypothetical protein